MYPFFFAVEKEQSIDDIAEEASEEEDEGIDLDEGEENDTEDPIDNVNKGYAVLTSVEPEVEDQSPALQDVLSESHLHLPGFSEVECLALALLKLADDGDQHLVPANIRKLIEEAASKIHDHDKSTRSFVKKYENKWGYTLFGRCLGPESPENRAAQKTRFATRFTPGVKITEDSRLLYLIIKMLRNRPPASLNSSPSKQATQTKAQYKRILDRVLDDPILSALNLPLPHINNRSITLFIRNEEKKANYKSTVIPKVKSHKQVMSTAPIPEAAKLPNKLTSSHPEVQYPVKPHVSGKRPLEKRRLDFEDPQTLKRKQSATVASPTPVPLKPRPIEPSDMAPILLVTPTQAQGPTIRLDLSSNQLMIKAPPKQVVPKTVMPGKSNKPCGACNVPKCGGLRQRYTPPKEKAADSRQKIFTYCPTTGRSTTKGFDDVYDNYSHFKAVVDEYLNICRTRKANDK